MRLFFIIIITLISLLGILIFLVIPKRRKNNTFFEKRMFAHRGFLNGTHPENSISAFLLAEQLGYGVELDVRLTKDSVPVVFHDRTLERLCGDKRRIDSVTSEELKAIRLCDSDEGIPSLAEVVATLKDAPIICEVKTNSLRDTDICVPVARILSARKAPTAVQSFNPFALRRIRSLAPSIIRGQLSGGEKNPVAFLLRSQLLNFISRPDFASYNIKSRRSIFLRICRRLFGLRLILWTSRETSPATDSDGVIFEG